MFNDRPRHEKHPPVDKSNNPNFFRSGGHANFMMKLGVFHIRDWHTLVITESTK
jgi:hypothetical protein